MAKGQLRLLGLAGHTPWEEAGRCLTCSCSSASLVARSSSESELPESEELSSLLRLLSAPLLTMGAAGAGSAGASTGSSGILANLISNTSWGGTGGCPEHLDAHRAALLHDSSVLRMPLICTMLLIRSDSSKRLGLPAAALW
jgi:hypothetical protein